MLAVLVGVFQQSIGVQTLDLTNLASLFSSIAKKTMVGVQYMYYEMPAMIQQLSCDHVLITIQKQTM